MAYFRAATAIHLNPGEHPAPHAAGTAHQTREVNEQPTPDSTPGTTPTMGAADSTAQNSRSNRLIIEPRSDLVDIGDHVKAEIENRVKAAADIEGELKKETFKKKDTKPAAQRGLNAVDAQKKTEEGRLNTHVQEEIKFRQELENIIRNHALDREDLGSEEVNRRVEFLYDGIAQHLAGIKNSEHRLAVLSGLGKDLEDYCKTGVERGMAKPMAQLAISVVLPVACLLPVVPQIYDWGKSKFGNSNSDQSSAPAIPQSMSPAMPMGMQQGIAAY
jgi:hypothetical protein